MSASCRAASTPTSTRSEPRPGRTAVAELNCDGPAESRKTRLPPVNNQIIPDELQVSLSSTVSNKITHGHTAHDRHSKGSGIRRPDAVWHHPLGRKKYNHLLDQPTSVTGAGRDISFLCDATVSQRKSALLPPVTDKSGIEDTQNTSISETLIPDDYYIVQNKGLRSLEFYEDAFTVKLQDDEEKLRVFPSLKPSGRLEVVQLMRVMDDMLLKAGVDQQSEELSELSQMENLLELVQVEQKIYNIVFHELIRQVSVNCSERGQLLAKLRQHYQLLLERIPHCVKALHTEVVAQRALERRLSEEIHRIKKSMQEISIELAQITNHDAFVTQQAELAHRQLAGALEQTNTISDVVQGYHELYEMQRGRLEAQLLQMTEERDCWSKFTVCLALKVINVKKLQLVSQLHMSEQMWSQTAKHCSLFLSSEDTKDLNTIKELMDDWKKQLTGFVSLLKTNEHAQRDQITDIHRGITKWLNFFNQNNNCPDPKYQRGYLEKIHANIKDWSNLLALQCECYKGKKLLDCQQTVGELTLFQDKWINLGFKIFKRHPAPDGHPPGGQQALGELDRVLTEHLKQLDIRVNGENGIYGQILSLLRSIESWVSKLGAVISRPETMSISDWQKLEKVLQDWLHLTEEALKNVSSTQTDTNKTDIYKETDCVLDKVQEIITSISNFSDSENKRLCEEVTSLHNSQTRWMLNMLLFMVPTNSEDQNQEQEEYSNLNISLQTLDKDSMIVAERLEYFSRYIMSSCKLILELQIRQNPHDAEAENEMNECKKLQREFTDWVETSNILLSGVKSGVSPADPEACSDASVSSAPNKQTVMGVKKEVSEEQAVNSVVKHGSKAALTEVRALTVCLSPEVKLIGYDGHIASRKLEHSSVHLKGSEQLVVSPSTDYALRAFSDLTTVGLLQQQLHDSELRLQSAEQRALEAEEALQAALQKLQDQERVLEGRPSLEPKSGEEKKKTPAPVTPPATPPAPPSKITAETKPGSRKTKKR